MTDVATGKPFWKAITLSVTTALSPHEVVQRLIKDGVLSGKLPDGTTRYR